LISLRYINLWLRLGSRQIDESLLLGLGLLLLRLRYNTDLLLNYSTWLLLILIKIHQLRLLLIQRLILVALFCLQLFLRILIIFCNLTSWDCSFAINPLPLNSMRIFRIHYYLERINVTICHESETPRLPSPLVLQNGTIFNFAELIKVRFKFFITKVVREPTNKNFSKLRVQ